VSRIDRLRDTGRGHVPPRYWPAGPAAALRRPWQRHAPFVAAGIAGPTASASSVRAAVSSAVLIFAATPPARRPTGPQCCPPRSVSATGGSKTPHSGRSIIVACHGHGTTLRGFLPRGWDHLVASDGTTRRVVPVVLVAFLLGCRQVVGLGGWGRWCSGRSA
jgi:hypothetical protein